MTRLTAAIGLLLTFSGPIGFFTILSVYDIDPVPTLGILWFVVFQPVVTGLFLSRIPDKNQ